MDKDSFGQHVDETYELHTNGTTYTVHIICEGVSLSIEVERRDDATIWKAQFGTKYIEDITQRTHSFKPFPVFVRMLLTALRKDSESVFVDLLTYEDLEVLKSKRTGQQTGAVSNQGNNNKRYLILTYAAEFDRVHYPLPLVMEDPDPQRLKSIIRQLRQQLDVQLKKSGCLQQGAGTRHSESCLELGTLRDENEALKKQLASLNGSSTFGTACDMQQLTAEAQATVQDLRQMRKERDALMLRAQQADAALEGERNLHRREMRRKLKEQHDIISDLSAAKEQIRELRLKCRELTQELDLAQRRAKVGNLSASYLERARQSGPRPMGRSVAVTPSTSRGISPAGSRHSSRGNSPATAFRAPHSGVSLSSQQRSRSAGPDRPQSAPRFDPTEYIRQRRDKQQAAAQRLEDVRRQQRLQLLPSSRPASRPTSRPQSLSNSRHSSMPNTRHSTPARSRLPSRDSSVDRGRMEWERRNSRQQESSVACRDVARQTQRVTNDTTRRDDRATSPGRALLEVKEKLGRFAKQSYTIEAQKSCSGQLIENGLGQRPKLENPTSNSYIEATTEIADIDARLQSLQQFLKAAKAGVPSQAPT